MKRVQRSGRHQVVVAADVGAVWRVLSDVTRIGEWSHECRSASWLSGERHAAPGARFVGRNRVGWLRWSRTAEVTIADEPHVLAWRTVPTWGFPDSTDWRVDLAETEEGTVITQSFRVLKGAPLLERLYARLIPSHQNRDAGLTEDLVRLGAVARREART